MKFFRKPTTQVILFYFLIILTAISLSGKSLLSLPFFYNQSAQQRLITFLVVALVFCILVYFTSRIFILPYLRKLFEWKNLILIIVLVIFISMMLGINSAPYWAFPEIHEVEICFDAQVGGEHLRIEKLVEPSTNRLLPSDSFNHDRYPIQIPSGDCSDGRLVYLPSLLTRSLITPRLSVIIDENPPAGRFYISINEVPSVVNFKQEEESQTELIITEGFEQGKPMEGPWKQYWFLGVKIVAIFLSAMYLSLFLHGLAEVIITGSNSEKANE
jgi:hypothetical protein